MPFSCLNVKNSSNKNSSAMPSLIRCSLFSTSNTFGGTEPLTVNHTNIGNSISKLIINYSQDMDNKTDWFCCIYFILFVKEYFLGVYYIKFWCEYIKLLSLGSWLLHLVLNLCNSQYTKSKNIILVNCETSL